MAQVLVYRPLSSTPQKLKQDLIVNDLYISSPLTYLVKKEDKL